MPWAVPTSWTPRSAMVRAACASKLGADFVDHHDFRHVVLDRLDHDRMLFRRARHLHTSCATDRRMRNIAVARNLVRGIDDHHALAEIVGQHAGDFAQQGRLADTRLAEQQHTLAFFDQILDDIDRAKDSSTDAAGYADHRARSITHRRDTVQRALDTGAVIFAEVADARRRYSPGLRARPPYPKERSLPAAKARLGQSSQVHDDLDQILVSRIAFERHDEYGAVGHRAAALCYWL